MSHSTQINNTFLFLSEKWGKGSDVHCRCALVGRLSCKLLKQCKVLPAPISEMAKNTLGIQRFNFCFTGAVSRSFLQLATFALCPSWPCLPVQVPSQGLCPGCVVGRGDSEDPVEAVGLELASWWKNGEGVGGGLL